MLIFLVFLIVLILIFGGAAILSAALGILGWIVGAIAFLAFVVWFSTNYSVPVEVLIPGLILGIPAVLFVVAWTLHTVENQKLPPEKRRTFSQAMKDADKS